MGSRFARRPELSLCRYLAPNPAEVAVLLEHIALVVRQTVEDSIQAIFLDRLSGSPGEKFKAGFRHRIKSLNGNF